jgi:hypothetical protein
MKRTFTVNFGAIVILQVLAVRTEFVELFNFLREIAKLDFWTKALCVRAFCHEYAFFEGSRREFWLRLGCSQWHYELLKFNLMLTFAWMSMRASPVWKCSTFTVLLTVFTLFVYSYLI